MKKIAILIIVVVGLFSCFFFSHGRKAKIDYEVFKVRRGIRNTAATGTIEPITQVEVGTQVSGTIARILVDYNSG
ncbi:MAG: hypothetical protein ACLU4N_17320 [Butyricimonas faecihominis]